MTDKTYKKMDMYARSISKTIASTWDKEIFWCFTPHVLILNRKRYRGIGRPRKSDYYRRRTNNKA